MPRKFDFISPGILLNEVDESVLPAETQDEGPLLIGRALTGPAMKPVRVKNLEDLYAVFGYPVTGKGALNSDVWRDGNLVAPTYAMYAAQAHLASGTTPVTFIRLAGQEADGASGDGECGWELAGVANPTTDYDNNATAYGLFVAPSGTLGDGVTGSLCAVFYTNGAALALSGTKESGGAAEGAAELFKINTTSDDYKLMLSSSDGKESFEFSFDESAPNYIRNKFNTNPQKLNAFNNFGTDNVKYFLGETFDLAHSDIVGKNSTVLATILPLQTAAGDNWADRKEEAKSAETGYFINRTLDGNNIQLFKLVAHSVGEYISANYWIQIEDLKLGSTINPNSSFTVKIMRNGTAVETYTNCNLNPSSGNYISKKIGDQYQVWDKDDKKWNVKGLYPNKSDYFYVSVNPDVENQVIDDSLAIPIGFEGPLVHPTFYVKEGEATVSSQGGGVGHGVSGDAASVEFDIVATADLQEGKDVSIVFDDVTYVVTLVGAGGTDEEFTDANPSGTVKTAQIDIITDDTTFVDVGDAMRTLVGTITGLSTSGTLGNVIATSDTTGASTTIDISATASPTFVENINFTPGTNAAGSTDYVLGGASIPFTASADASNFLGGMGTGREIEFNFPAPKLTKEDSKGDGNYLPSDVFGLRHIPDKSTLWDKSYADVVRRSPVGAATFSKAYTFKLEDIVEDSGLYYWHEGTAAYKDKLSELFALGIRKFAAPVVGGSEGVNILNTDPFASTFAEGTIKNSYVRNTLEEVLDIAADAEATEYDLISIPGQTNEAITNRMISICETRGDALAIIDLEGIYVNRWENGGKDGEGSVKTVISEAQERVINSSYVATYYPSIKMSDTTGGAGDVLIVPPSVAAIGAIAKSQAVSDPWFAPAGFNRGGINELGGTQGPRVIGTMEHLSKANRDSLYEENINPIARFPASGDIVIFGQKTMQQLPSALDRINVRRLLLYIKRRIGKVSETILFDQNVQATWNRFRAQAERILSDVQSRLGIVEYKLVLDETTTTADLVDRNILYAKVLIKPARALEFIVVDFVVTRSGIEL